MQRIVSNWPEYQGYQTQMLSEERSISSRRESNVAQAARPRSALQRKYSKVTDQLSQQIRDVRGQDRLAAAAQTGPDARGHRLRRRRHHRRRREGAQHHGEGRRPRRARRPVTRCWGRCRSWPRGSADASSATAAFTSRASAPSTTRRADALTFATDEAYFAAALASTAAAILVDASLARDDARKAADRRRERAPRARAAARRSVRAAQAARSVPAPERGDRIRRAASPPTSYVGAGRVHRKRARRSAPAASSAPARTSATASSIGESVWIHPHASVLAGCTHRRSRRACTPAA